MKLNKFLLTSAAIVPALAPSLTLTSCSQTWGYLNPISFGSIDKGNANDPYQAFRSQTNVYFDANGQDITKYLQSNFIIDQAKSSVYAYTSPVTKWYQTKEEAGEEEPVVYDDLNKWERLNDGWKTSSDNISTSVTLDDPNPDKPDGVKKTYTNNENFNLVSNINFTCTIASTIANYLTYGLQYQASQISVGDKDMKNLNAAWGSQSSLLGVKAETGWIQTKDKEGEKQNRDFYEYIFASANSHSTGKTNSFLRPISANFNFENGYFPFPTYAIGTPIKGDIDVRTNISPKTKQLLMHNDAIKFCESGIITDKQKELAYYTDIKDVKVNIPYKKLANEVEWDSYPLTVKQYLFSSVPIIVDATNLSAKWVDPTKNDSFVPSDYFINDSETVNKAIGNSWEKISEFATGEAKSTIKKFDFDLTKSGTSHRTFDVNVDPEKGIDPRINATMNGNSFVVLVSYVVNEYDSNKSLKARDKYFTEKGMAVPEELSDANLAKLNAASINSIESIFPAYLLSISDNDLFKIAHKDIEDKDEGTTTKFGYIINSSTVSKHNNDLLGLLRRSSQEGMKPYASELSQESKDLLAFLGFMFASTGNTLSTDFLQTDPWQN